MGPGGLFVIECFIQDLTEFDRGQRVATRALTEDSVEMEFVTDDPVASAVSYQRVTFGARALRCGRYGCAAAGRVSWT